MISLERQSLTSLSEANSLVLARNSQLAFKPFLIGPDQWTGG